jgi:hypothetical protein
MVLLCNVQMVVAVINNGDSHNNNEIGVND